jgi:hypothetical protein
VKKRTDQPDWENLAQAAGNHHVPQLPGPRITRSLAVIAQVMN